jgi:hypothetical protein
MGVPPDEVASRDAMSDPDSIQYFVDFAAQSADYDWRVRAAGEAS